MLRGLFLASLIAAAIGGWAVITVEQLPDYVTAGQPVTLTFTVRQHGVTRLSGLKPRIEARSGDVTTTATASPGRETGQYVSTLRLPRAGEWTITIHSGFMNSHVTLLPLQAITPGVTMPLPLPEHERGRRLFVAKGCVTCHVHRDVAGSGVVAVGPELTNHPLPTDYLKQFLANPGVGPQNSTGRMPNLGLESQEIAALVAFLSAERHALR
jgi:hypothetical protein